jgi:hypothetical protein
MTPVIGLLAHRDAEQVRRLVRALHPLPVVIHLDSRAPANDFRHIAGLGGRAYFTERRPVAWAGMSMVHAMIAIVDFALRRRDEFGDGHLVFLSEHCYPLRSVEAIAAGLSDGRQYCNAMPVSAASAEHAWKLSRRHHFELEGRLTASRVPPFGAKVVRKVADALDMRRSARPSGPVYVGSQWVALTLECLASIRPSLNSLTQELAGAFAPDELVFQTAVHRSPWRDELAMPSRNASDLRPAELSNLHHLDRSMSKIFGIADLDELCDSDRLFVRKTTRARSSELLDELDRRLRC